MADVQNPPAFRDFAKIHQTSLGQVLVMLDQNSNDLPAVCLVAHLQSGEIVKVHIGGWQDDDAGWAKADNAFAMFDADAAANFAHKIVNQILGGAS